VTASPLGRTTQFTLAIAEAPTIDVTCTPSPTPAYIGQSTTWTGTYSGGTAPYTFSWSGTNIPTDPAPTTNPYQITYTTIGLKTTTLTVTDDNGDQGSCSSGGEGGGGVELWVNFDPSFREF